MTNYKTNDQILQTVFGLLAGLPVNKYTLVKPTKNTDSEYIVLNALPINADVMQKCIVNVNYHVKDIADGVPNLARLEAGAQSVLAILRKVSTTTYMIDFEGQELFQEQAQREHFTNLRFSYININT